MTQVWDWTTDNIWRSFVVVLLLGFGMYGSWEFYWWNQWLKQVSYQQQMLGAYLSAPVVELPDKRKLSRAQVIDALIGQAVKPADVPTKIAPPPAVEKKKK